MNLWNANNCRALCGHSEYLNERNGLCLWSCHAYSRLNFFFHVFLISKISLISCCLHAAVSHFSSTFADGLIEQKSNDWESGVLDSRFVSLTACVHLWVRAFHLWKEGDWIRSLIFLSVSVWIPVMLSAFKVLHSSYRKYSINSNMSSFRRPLPILAKLKWEITCVI